MKDTLLIVDDSPDNLTVLHHFLSRVGYEVLVAQDGEKAIEMVKYARPHLVLLDVMMPDMDGFEVCRRLKSDVDTQSVPIIFMTALSDKADKVYGFSLGATDYITKPVQYEEVLARVNTHLNLYKLQRQLQQNMTQLAEYATQLEVRNRELDTFSRAVAHDLRNPVGVIRGYIEIIQLQLERESVGSPAEVFVLEKLKKINQVTYQMFEIIDALLLLARVSNHHQLDIESVDMGQIISHLMLNRLYPMILKYQAEIHLPPTWISAKGNAAWIEEVWFNYLSNALKYGGNPPVLRLGCALQGDGMVKFWVQDNGKGIDSAAIHQLFQPFSRLPGNNHIEGHGLGLSIVRQIVEKLQGSVGVESELNQGSVFYFLLPAG